METAETARIDKYLWAVRLYRTRTQATESCRKGRVRIGEEAVKPSRPVREGETVAIRESGVWLTFRVVGVIEKRVGAKLVADYLEEVTPPEVREELEERRRNRRVYRGTGRPSKKDRRDLEKLLADSDEHERHFRDLVKKKETQG